MLERVREGEERRERERELGRERERGREFRKRVRYKERSEERVLGRMGYGNFQEEGTDTYLWVRALDLTLYLALELIFLHLGRWAFVLFVWHGLCAQ